MIQSYGYCQGSTGIAFSGWTRTGFRFGKKCQDRDFAGTGIVTGTRTVTGTVKESGIVARTGILTGTGTRNLSKFPKISKLESRIFQKLDIRIPVRIPVNFSMLTWTRIPVNEPIFTGTGILPGSWSILGYCFTFARTNLVTLLWSSQTASEPSVFHQNSRFLSAFVYTHQKFLIPNN